MNVLEYAKQQAADLSVTFEVRDEGPDAFEISKEDSGSWKIVGSNERSCLWGLYHLQQGGQAGIYRPRFSVRGINPCESLLRHTPEQIETLIDRMARWRMNTIILHVCYGYQRYGELIEKRCAERGIDIIYYLQTAIAFTSHADVSVFAVDEHGNLRTPHACNETRLCPSKTAARQTFREGARAFFESDTVQPGSTYVLMDGDGYLFCQCETCRQMKPADQWAVFLEIAVEEAERADKNLKIEYLSYVWRYARPHNFELFEHIHGIMFDTHQRFRWAPINHDHPASPYSQVEAQVDERAAHIPLNRYLYDRLHEWRENFENRIYVFENLMIQGAISCPQPYTGQLLQDLDTYETLGVDGVIYEAFEPGMESYDRQITMLAEGLWEKVDNYQPTELEKLCIKLTGDEVSFDFKNQFNVISYLSVQDPNAIELLRQDGFDDVLIHYASLLRAYLQDKSLKNYAAITTYAMQHKDRLDWIMQGFNLIRAVLRDHPRQFDDEALNRFLTVSKLWDWQEQSNTPIEDTEAMIKKIVSITS